MRMVLGFATRRWEGYKDCIDSWQPHPFPTLIVEDMDVLDAYQIICNATDEPIIGLPHDDVVCLEKGWHERVLREFSDPTVGMVCFGGGRGHGSDDLYTAPYKLSNLARRQFMSNMEDAEKHGIRFTGECDVAVADAFAVFIRRSVLERWGGFPHGKPVGYYMWCENVCCEVHRQGLRIRLVGVYCRHIGGRTSTVHQVTDDYEAEHKYFYENNKDVMPYRVKE